LKVAAAASFPEGDRQPERTMLLTDAELTEIRTAVEQALLATGAVYDANTRIRLARGIRPSFFLGLNVLPAPKAQLRFDLETFNNVERLSDGSVPLEIWLRNACELLEDQKEVAVLQAKLAKVSLQMSGAPPMTNLTAPSVPPGSLPGRLEKTIHRDDMLPFDFVAGAQRVGASVALLEVPEFENGQLKLKNGEPIVHLGTGWLVAPRLLMTNWHVVNAREDNHPASAADLTAQGKSLTAQFDFDADEVKGVRAKTSKLVAANSTLDYALVRLASATAKRPPLRMASKPLNVQGPDDYVAVNIIQHPGGRAKHVAIRNNLVYRTVPPTVSYFTDTTGGSSGSPVCTDKWLVVALHKSWDVIPGVNFQGRLTAVVNEGTDITAILADLKQAHPALHAEIVKQ
jgi:endonuclease G